VPSLKKRLIAEILGTFFLVFMGTLAITTSDPTVGASSLTAGLAFAVGALGAVYSFGHISGAHINPAVTISLAVRGKFPWKEVLPYVIAQLIGAISAALLNAGIVGNSLSMIWSLGATYPNRGLLNYRVNPDLAALVCEIAITFILVLTILSVTEKEAPSGFAGLAIGLIYGLNVTIAANISGGSMNPARTFGPQIVLILLGDSLSIAFESAWVYWIGPIVGGLLAATVHWLKS
jgi:glycerol uptake facilitator protein